MDHFHCHKGSQPRITAAICKARGCADECRTFIRHTKPLNGLAAYLVALANEDMTSSTTGAGAVESPAPERKRR